MEWEKPLPVILHHLLDKLSPTSPLQKLAPAIASLFSEPGKMESNKLACLLEQSWITEDVFGACLNHLASANVSDCVKLLDDALDRFTTNDNLLACLWNLQVPV